MVFQKRSTVRSNQFSPFHSQFRPIRCWQLRRRYHQCCRLKNQFHCQPHADQPRNLSERGQHGHTDQDQAAERNDVRALEAMLAAGFDPNRPDSSIGKTALHSAAMEGWPDAVRVLLAHGASVHIRDREFNGQPLVWAAEGSRQHREGRDFAAVGKLLLDASG